MAIALGVLVLLAVVISLTGWHVRPTTSTLVGAGMVSGVMGTLTSVGGPPMALVYQREQAAKLRSTLAGFFVFGASLALLALALSGELGKQQVVDGFILLPGLLVGLTLSRLLAPHLDRGWTRAAVLGLSAATATALVVGALTLRRAGDSWPASTPSAISSGGHGAPPTIEATAAAIAGAVLIPAPPCPTSQQNPGASGSHPTTGRRSTVNVRRPAHELRTWRTSNVVASASISSAQATSSISAAASTGSLGCSSAGDSSSPPASGSK